MRHLLWSAVLGLALVAPASAETYFGFHIGIGNAPPPPRVVFYHQPEVVFVPGAGVYVVENSYGYDMFRSGGYYYTCDNGYWYRARSYRGPFRVVDVRYVPRGVFSVPERHWKHHWKHTRYARSDDDRDRRDRNWKDTRYARNDDDRDRDRGERGKQKRGRGRGHGNHD